MGSQNNFSRVHRGNPPPRLPDLQNFQITQFQISINLKKKGEGKSVPLLARGAQRIPGS